MTATLEQTQSDLLKLVNLVQHGEEVVITSQGRAVAKLSAVPQMRLRPTGEPGWRGWPSCESNCPPASGEPLWSKS